MFQDPTCDRSFSLAVISLCPPSVCGSVSLSLFLFSMTLTLEIFCRCIFRVTLSMVLYFPLLRLRRMSLRFIAGDAHLDLVVSARLHHCKDTDFPL